METHQTIISNLRDCREYETYDCDDIDQSDITVTLLYTLGQSTALYPRIPGLSQELDLATTLVGEEKASQKIKLVVLATEHDVLVNAEV